MSSSEGRGPKVQAYQLPRFDSPGTPQAEKIPFQRFAFSGTSLLRPWDFAQEARRVVEAARLKAQHLERQGFEEGFQMGFKAGQEMGEKGLEPWVKRFQAMITGLGLEMKVLSARREQDLVELALIIAAKVTERELALRPEAIREMVARGFQLLSQSEGIKLRVNPQDYEILRQAPPDSWGSGVEMAPDSGISPGGFWLGAADGEIDGTRESRWTQVTRAVEEVLHGTQTGDAPG
jgi:flagellar biosynthesis/type III secretory pathway protein FliH